MSTNFSIGFARLIKKAEDAALKNAGSGAKSVTPNATTEPSGFMSDIKGRLNKNVEVPSFSDLGKRINNNTGAGVSGGSVKQEAFTPSQLGAGVYSLGSTVANSLNAPANALNLASETGQTVAAVHNNNSILHSDVTPYTAPKSTTGWDSSKLDPSKMGYNKNKPIYNMDNAAGLGESGKVHPAVLSQAYNRQNELAADEQITRGAPGISHDNREIVKQQADVEAGGAFGAGSKGIWGRAGDFVGQAIPGAETAGKWADSLQGEIPIANKYLGAGSYFQMPYANGKFQAPIGNYIQDASNKLSPVQNIADNGSLFEKGQAAWDMGPQIAFGDTKDKMLGLSSQDGQNNLTNTAQKITSQGDKYGDNAKLVAGGAGVLGIGALLAMMGGGGQQRNTTVNNYNGPGLPQGMREEEDKYKVRNFNMIS